MAFDVPSTHQWDAPGGANCAQAFDFDFGKGLKNFRDQDKFLKSDRLGPKILC